MYDNSRQFTPPIKGAKCDKISKRWTKFFLCLLSCLLLIWSLFLILVYQRIGAVFGAVFGAVSLDQVLFHAMMPKEAIDSGIIDNFCTLGRMQKCLIAMVVALCLGILLLPIKRVSVAISRLLIYLAHRPSLFVFVVVSLIFLMTGVIFCHRFSVFSGVMMLFRKSPIISENLVEVSLKEFRQVDGEGRPLEGTAKPNLILIVSESMESTFADERLFGVDLIPELTTLRQRGDSIHNLWQVKGCHYTIASMYSLLYGLPLLYLQCESGAPTRENIFAGKCVSIFDVLDATGYKILHLQGTSLKFAGQGKLFSYLPHATCMGVEECSLNEFAQRQRWGLWDSDLFAKAKSEVLKVAQGDAPFALSMQTIDTHVGNTLQPGQLCEYGDMRDIIRLQSRLIGDFVQWVEQQPFGENTVIVIVGDHNMLVWKMGGVDLTNPAKRRVYNCILNSKSTGSMEPRVGAMFDFAPTILDALAFQWPSYALGIGKSLYRQTPTILEKTSVEQWNNESRKCSQKYKELLHKPQCRGK